MDLSKKVKFNPSFAYSHPSQGTVKIISLEDDDNKVYMIKGLSAEIFIKLVNGEDASKIVEFVKSQKDAPSPDQIQNFISKFIDDLTKLNVLQSA